LRRARIHSEQGDGLCEAVDLVFEGAGGGRGFLDQRGVLLGDLVHLLDRGGGLLDALRLPVSPNTSKRGGRTA
jgi:hypothetical protein